MNKLYNLFIIYMSTSKYLHISIIIYIIITSLFIHYRNKTKKVKKIFNRPEMAVGFLLSLIWSLYILKFNAFGFFSTEPKELSKFKLATTHAITALVIATFAYLELIIPTFWFVLIIGYFIELPVGIY